MSATAPLSPPPSWVELSQQPTALFLDIDGTLLEFESHPDLVRATDSLILLLQSISGALDGAVALISGRPLIDIDRVFSPWRPFAAGGHGAEVRGGAGTRLHRLDSDQLRITQADLIDGVAAMPGAWIEDKGYGFALHYREAPKHEAAAVALVERVAGASNGTLEVQRGAYVQELRPASFDKGLALDELMAQPPFLQRRPVVVGDDHTDEDAFAAAHQHGGISVLVGPRDDTVAQYRIADPEAGRGWLTEIPEEVFS
ncbi:MAG: trehalose-phosphatase [Actinomycetia bacterium]|nr:trehalose-phosphatase [Actinomycetes bacterium]